MRTSGKDAQPRFTPASSDETVGRGAASTPPGCGEPNQRGVHPALSDRPGTLPSMTLTLAMVTTDSTDPGPRGLVGGAARRHDRGGQRWLLLHGAGAGRHHDVLPEGGRSVAGKEPAARLDLVSADRPAEVQRLVAAGATKIADRDGGGFWWTTLADPAGNEFCVADATTH